MASSRASTGGSEMNASTPICSGRLRTLVKKWKLGGWITTPGDRIALLQTCLRLRLLRAPCGEKENNNKKWSPYWSETKIRPCPEIGTSSNRTRRTSVMKCLTSGVMAISAIYQNVQHHRVKPKACASIGRRMKKVGPEAKHGPAGGLGAAEQRVREGHQPFRFSKARRRRRTPLPLLSIPERLPKVR